MRAASCRAHPKPWRYCMFKYVIAWLLGVPAGLLVLIYIFTHLF
ncbi:hypothetical protein FHW12_003395 [Dokdonella fugitiva]|uniref:Uncharacterized protein n=1 Tax=Dokdonella fugitiva TaxID=328517 RepID=A0A839F519_9GAMM|nr:hypothetical protein [Dokdonella fugitiva]MBA8889152.1 hypothetical protein [Dokdonella fugitiva]